MKARRKPRRALVALPDDKAQTLRDTIHNGLGNIGILAAFMCALANAIYTSPPEDPRCFGHVGVTYILVIEWVAMALFFISMLTSVVLASDLDGVPNDRLIEHLSYWPVHILYVFPQLCILAGIAVLSVGYGIDLGERRGCVYSQIFVPAACLCTVFVIAISSFARKMRARLNRADDTRMLGSALFTTWSDRYFEWGEDGEDAVVSLSEELSVVEEPAASPDGEETKAALPPPPPPPPVEDDSAVLEQTCSKTADAPNRAGAEAGLLCAY